MTVENSPEAEQEVVTNITRIDDLRIEKLAQNGNYWGIFDTWNTLEIRIAYGEQLDPPDAFNYCLLVTSSQPHSL